VTTVPFTFGTPFSPLSFFALLLFVPQTSHAAADHRLTARAEPVARAGSKSVESSVGGGREVMFAR